MDTVTSRDGTSIAFLPTGTGAGAPVVFVAGVFNDHTTCAPVAALIEDAHPVITYDRRGRGASGDTAPYAVEREVEDLAALIEKAGAPAAVFGYSSGAVLALKAAADGAAISHLALYEPPFAFTDTDRARPADRPGRLADLVAQGRPGDAVALFQTEHLGMPAEMVARARRSPMWPALEAMAQSMVYDATITTALAVPTVEMTAVSTPTLILSGAETFPFLRDAAVALANAMPSSARHVELPGGRFHHLAAEPAAEALRLTLSQRQRF
ncbi:alpha/beta fold hydrolase [Thermomonospora umbrina]|uniref:Alpha-beta hydrolase superfamily lysophospholipase n=1 Tax=Thermomonospora umbrina TaxID=111806 RepID=A0A3D9SXX4_9ACTN|nr:alpha/beta hydrolase [Thermomonospora umbrina]REE97855.1 alpha-beta hydrolase superfamily lysophospholipase [Thermomonospora umbrina]